MILQSKAKQLAWNDLDNDDKRLYLREAQKQLNKESHWVAEECEEELEKLASEYDTKKSKRNKKK